jgi:lipopolysaccharide transport system permease protein
MNQRILESGEVAEQHALPDKPLIAIRPKDRQRSLDLAELWAFRETFYFLLWRDLKVRYKQTILGAAWVILQPLLMTLIFTVFLGMLVRVPSDGLPYALFALSGLLPWTFMNNAVASSGYSLIGNAPLITKIYFPRVLVPLVSVAVRLADLLITLAVASVVLLYYRTYPGFGILLYPLLVMELVLLAIGLGLWTAALNARYRDVGTLLPMALQLWMFGSPIVYPTSIVPEKWRTLYALNPLTGIIEGMRASLFRGEFDRPAIEISVVIVLLILVSGAYVFRRVEESFADVI